MRKTKPLERCYKSITKLPAIFKAGASIEQTFEDSKKDTTAAVDIEELIETKVRKLKQNAFLYMIYSVPRASEHFTPYNLK